MPQQTALPILLQIAATNNKARAAKKQKTAVAPAPTEQTTTSKITGWFYTTDSKGEVTVNYVHVILGAAGLIAGLVIIKLAIKHFSK